MNKRLNVRLLARLGAIVLVFGVAVHVVHAVQADRLARELRAQGDAADADGDKAQSARFFSRYLALRPDDRDVEARYGLALAEIAETTTRRYRAYHVLDKSLRGDPDNVTVRYALGNLAVKLGQYEAALVYLAPLREAKIDQGELEETLAWCHRGGGDKDKALAGFRRAIQIDPARLTSYQRLVDLLLELHRRDEAEAVLQAMIEANPTVGAARIVRARYLEKEAARQESQGEIELGLTRMQDAANEFEQAVKLGPKIIQVLLEAAAFERRRGRPDRARKLLHDAVRFSNNQERPVFELALLEEDGNRLDTAIRLLQEFTGKKEPQTIALLGALLLRAGQADELKSWPGSLEKESTWSHYLEALRLLEQGDVIEAARRLEALAPRVSGMPSWASRVQGDLARCYAQCSDYARHRDACRRAQSWDPASKQARLTWARALTAEGRAEEACKVWKKLMSDAEPPSDGWLDWGLALTRHNLNTSATASEWREVERLLDQAAKVGADPAVIAVARAEALAAQKQLDAAEKLLLHEIKTQSEKVTLQVALADLHAHRGNYRQALEVLRGNVTVPARLARLRYAQYGGTQVPQASNMVDDALRNLDELSAADKATLLRSRTELAEARSDTQETTAWRERWGRSAPHDLAAELMRVELSVRSGAFDELPKVTRALRHIEGDAGLRWRCVEVFTRILGLRSPDPDAAASLKECQRLLQEAARQARDATAGVGQAMLLEGRLEEIQGHTDQAIFLYQRAFELGMHGDAETTHLVELLRDKDQATGGANRFTDIDSVLTRWERENRIDPLRQSNTTVFPVLYPAPTGRLPRRLPPSLARLGTEAALKKRKITRALELAERAVPPGTGSHGDLLWLADIYDRADHTEKAARVLTQLVEKHGDLGETWLALIRHLVRHRQRAEAEALIPKAKQKLPTDDATTFLVVALCYEAVGRPEEAESWFKRALHAAPQDPLTLRHVGRFYLDSDQPEKAILPLHALARSPYGAGNEAWARRALATVPLHLQLLKRSIPARVEELLTESALSDLLAHKESAGKESIADLRARALVIAAQPGRAAEGITLFEETLSQGALTPDEKYWLAQLYDVADKRLQADKLMEELLTQEPHRAFFFAGQVRLLLRRDPSSPAESPMKRLVELEPDAARLRKLPQKAQ